MLCLRVPDGWFEECLAESEGEVQCRWQPKGWRVEVRPLLRATLQLIAEVEALWGRALSF